MEIFLLLIVLTILIILVVKLSSVRDEVKTLNDHLIDIKTLINSNSQPETKPMATVAVPPKIIEPIPSPVLQKPVIPVERQPIITPAQVKQETPPLKQETAPAQKPLLITPAQEVHIPSSYPSASSPGWFQKWLQDNPDIEKFIGENLINKIGISVLVLGIAFFVKYAIDQEWINKIGRVCIGLLCAAILTGLAHRLRKNYHAFSSVLVGGSLTVFYFTIAFAFHQYHLISQTAAFAIMVVITIFAVLISILYDRVELGILATIGGFITPFLVSDGEGNWLALFSYLSILNAGLIVLAYYERWRAINFIAFFFTQIIYLGWVISKSDSPNFNHQGIFIFGLIFYIMFLAMNIVHHVFRKSPLKAFDFIILLSANLCFFGAGIDLIRESGVPQFSGLFTASLGVVNLILAYLFLKKSKADKNFVYLLVAITVSFISIAAPIQLERHFITLFWSAEIVVLLWLYQKSFISLLKIAILLVTLAMLVSLMMDWWSIYGDNSIHPVLLNKGWITGVFCALSFFLAFSLLRNEADTYFVGGISNRLVRNIYIIGSIILLFTAGSLEINSQFSKRIPGSALEIIYLNLYSTVFVLILLTIFSRFKVRAHPLLHIVLSFATLAMYLFSIYQVHATEQIILFSQKNKGFFIGSWVNAILLLVLVWKIIQNIRANREDFTCLSLTSPGSFQSFVWPS